MEGLSGPVPRVQLLGQIPVENIISDSVFNQFGLDCAEPFNLKHGSIRKPSLSKAYICIFVTLSIKAVHLEPVSDLSMEALIAALRQYIAGRGKFSLIWSDYGKSFVMNSSLLPEPDDTRCRLKILCHLKRDVEVYPGTDSSLWETMGVAVKSMKT